MIAMQPALADLVFSLGPAIALAAGAIALTTALISRRTAVEEREARRVEREAAAPANAPGVLLPPRLHGFVNRTEAMEEAITRIGDGERVLAIAGGAGVGKSAVASELVHRLRAEGTVDGVPDLSAHDFLWIDGRDGCPTLIDICRQVTLLTGDQSLSAVADSAKLEALRAHFARNKTVLLLDNLRLSGEDPGEPLRELLRTIPSGSLAIASLNSPYALDGSRVLLTDLEPGYVLELIQREVRRLGLQEDLFDVDFATRLQQAVGGNPRLIESFLRALGRSSRTLEQLLEAVERGEGLRELYLPVWGELSALGHSVLGACASLRGEAIADQLTVACAVSSEELTRALEELMQTGLVTVVRGHMRPDVYTCSYSVQRFVMTETPRETVRAIACRLAGHYIRQLATEPENARWVAPHVGAIKAVMQLLYDHGEDAEVQSLFASVLDVLFTLGLFDDRISTGQIAYESAMRAGNPRGASLAIDVMVSTHAARGELEEAREAVALGLLAAERSGDPGERARMMRSSALVLYKDGDAAGALAALEGSGDLARETGDLEVLGNTCGLRTVAHWHAGEFEASAMAASEALSVCEEMSWHRAMAYPLRNLAEVAIHDGEFSQARKLLADAHRISTEHGDRRQLTRIHLTTARLELLSGDPAAAQREAFAARGAALELGLIPELREVSALQRAAARARFFPLLRSYYRARRPARFTDAPVGGD
jgi:tetratricopeptide (TPR) repeat protein